MAAKKIKRNWVELEDKVKDRVFNSITEAANYLSIPRRTLSAAISRGEIHPIILDSSPPVTDDFATVSFEENGNEAWLKYKSAEPLTPQEAMAIAGVDPDIWEMERPEINLWQMGRKDRQVDLRYNNGAATGFVKDSGKLFKTYLYQVKVKLTKKQRIPVIPVIEPVQILQKAELRKSEVLDSQDNATRVLFLTDPHFGFSVKPFEVAEPFHNRIFLSDLLAILIDLYFVDYVVWGGDILDLAEFSKFPTAPNIIQKTQIAGIEAAWLINQFGKKTKQQIFIEGNHDIRLKTAMAANFSAAYELRPVHELESDALLSVPRFLGFDKNPAVTWVDDYPNGFYDIDDSRFEHGHIAKSDSGATVTALSKQRMRSVFFGHIHRYESISKITEDGTMVYTATPGCACRRGYTPGSTRFSNWSNGAFVLTFVNGVVQPPELISHIDGKTYFRGNQYRGSDYLKHMKDELDSKYLSFL